MSAVAVADLEAVDLNDFSLFADGPPLDVFKRLRAEAPVHWNENGQFWSLTRYDDDVMVSKDWETFSSTGKGIFIKEGGIVPPEFTQYLFVMMDPPDHDKHRAILSKVFSSRAVLAREPQIRATINALIDEVIERGTCDFVTDIAQRLPLIVTADMLGVRDEDQGALFDWTNKMADTSITPEMSQQMLSEMAMFVLGMVSERREAPTEDLLSKLIHAEVEGVQLTDIEIVAHFAQLMAGGNETTRNAIAGGVLALAENPGERAKLLENPGLVPSGVEEILRWHTPIMHSARTVTRDIEIRGVPIKEGERVVVWHTSANRDEDHFAEPDRFDVSRGDSKHLAFNGGGKHYCLGNQVARLELKVCFEEILRRMPEIEIAGPVGRKPENTFHWMTSLPLSFTPGGRGG